MSLYVPSDISGISNWQNTKLLHRTLDMARTRLLVICGSFILIFLTITIRLVDVSLLKRSGEDTFSQSHIQKPAFRADIVDRNGELLATSLRTSSLYANARVVLDPKEAAQKLVQALPELNYNDTLHRLQSGKGFVWLARHLTPQKQAEVLRLGLPGVYFQQDERRVYPHGELFAHVLGYTNIDNQGLSGIERKFNDLLLSQGDPFALSLDVRVQHIMRDELLAGIEKYKAQGGAGLVMNVQTGEIIAMVSLPDFDPNHVNKIGSQKQALFNRLALGVYEMGSNFKIFTTALFLDKSKSNVHTKLDVSGPLRVGRFRITDIHPAHYPLTVTEIFIQSSNIGAAKMAMYLGSNLQQEFFKKLGFFQSPQLEIPELGSPLFPKQWSEPTLITASYGYGISITPLHLATAIAGIVNKGIMQQSTILKKVQDDSTQGRRVVSEKTSEIMRKLLYMVVAQGTGKKAGVNGYEVGGKTGTANQLVGKSYKDGTSTTSFTGVFPMTDPKYLVLIMVDRPQGIKETYGFNLGGWNAAPITGKVIRRIAPILQVIPTHEDAGEAGQNPLLIQACATQQEAP